MDELEELELLVLPLAAFALTLLPAYLPPEQLSSRFVEPCLT